MTKMTCKTTRLNKRKRKRYAVGEFVHNAVSLRLQWARSLNPAESHALHRRILAQLYAQRLVTGGLLHPEGAEILFHERNKNIADETLSALETTLKSLPGVASVLTTVHADAWADEHGVRHRRQARSLIPRLRNLLLVCATQADALPGTTLVIPRR